MRSFTPLLPPPPPPFSISSLFCGYSDTKSYTERKEVRNKDLRKLQSQRYHQNFFRKHKVSTPASELTGLLDAPAVLPTRSPDVKLTSRA